ncbi:hypothetical protein ACIOD2_44280 [Amycolatopsis sp. NPDC088138]|uniref:hypothetical protein n=1 Tax=Amycolatopsis sp. NPDC088138 TaxID=3363938 RepID=UPI0038295F44
MNADNVPGNPTPDKKGHSTQAVVAVVVAMITAVGGIIGTIITTSKDSNAGAGSTSSVLATAPTTSSPPSAPSTSPVESIAITSPTPGQGVVGHQGVQLTGTAEHIDGKQLRIFDLADDHKYYLITGESVPIANGRWSFFDPQVGSSTPDDNGHAFTLVVTVADPSCNGTLDTATPNAEGDIVYPALPAGCRETASVSIVKQS